LGQELQKFPLDSFSPLTTKYGKYSCDQIPQRKDHYGHYCKN